MYKCVFKISMLTGLLCLMCGFCAFADGPKGPGDVNAAGNRYIDPTKPMIAITFDDGPCTGPGNRIMDVFEAYGQRCTFFVVGNRVGSRTEEVRRMAEKGFEIGNHSWSHTYYNKLSGEQIQKDIARCNAAIRDVTGKEPTLIRLPGGIKGGSILSNVNLPVILWNIDTLDWKSRNADSITSMVLGKVKDGDIILMHELYSATASSVERIVPELVAQGYQLVTVSELVKFKNITIEPGKVYYDFSN